MNDDDRAPTSSTKKHQRTARTPTEMVEVLARHVRLLEAYVEKAESNPDYLGEIAAKLRLLIVDIPGNKRHKPLLLRVAEAYKTTLKVRTQKVPQRVELMWLAFLDSPAMSVSFGPDRSDPRVITYRDFIRAWAEQMGGSHEDWEIDTVPFMLNFLTVGRHPFNDHNLISIAQNVLVSAKQLLADVASVERVESLKANETR